MSDLAFAHGDGRLLRNEAVIAFCLAPNDELFSMLRNGKTVGGKELASFLVANDFELPPFIVIDLAAETLFVFGDLVVEAGSVTLDGSASSTFIEQKLCGSSIGCGTIAEPGGSLERGWVSASAFRFGISEAEPAQRTSEKVLTRKEPQESFSEQPEESAAEAPAPAPLPISELPVSDTDDEGGAEWDPLADPEVDLATIGAAPEVESLLTTPEPPPPPPPAPEELTDEAPEVTAPAMSPLPPPPSSLPPLQPVSDKSDKTLPAPPDFAGATPSASARLPPNGNTAMARHLLRFDDGQEVSVGTGIYVGRNPTKQGLPENYTSTTIRGEHVSRRHWEVEVTTGRATIRDLGSNSGTEVELHGQRVAVPDGGMEIGTGATIHFADRWAKYETE